VRFPRASGLLLHPTCLPGRYGIGDLGADARGFVRFLGEARQTLWQVLPLGPTGYGDSPYQCFSAFAGNPLLISPDDAAEDGALSHDDLRAAPELPDDRVEFGRVIAFKADLLAAAAARFAGSAPASLAAEYEAFRAAEAHWLDDYALFMALKDAHAGAPWPEWDRDLRRRAPSAVARARRDHAAAIARQSFLQFLFFRQWRRLRAEANAAGIRIVGDLPIFVAYDSADVWAHPDLFFLDRDGRPTVVAGVPPDYFSETGQRWGNPLYRWSVAERDGFSWWIARMRAALDLFDVVRIDHFIGFARYWEVPADEETAAGGRWCPGPGAAFFRALRRALGEDLPIIAEDLGAVTPAVEALRDEFDLTGMKVLQFAFAGGAKNPFLPHRYGANCAVYTGTHDNDTTVGWFRSAPAAERSFAQRYLARSGDDIAWDLIRAAMSSVADTAIAPVQDVLALGSEARMNVPGRPEGNWSWRLRRDELAPHHAARLAEMAEQYDRLATPDDEPDDEPPVGGAEAPPEPSDEAAVRDKEKN